MQDEKEHASTKAAVKEFLETDGPVMQDVLKEYAKDKARFVLSSHVSRPFNDCADSYIEEFWYEHFIVIISSAYSFHHS